MTLKVKILLVLFLLSFSPEVVKADLEKEAERHFCSMAYSYGMRCYQLAKPLDACVRRKLPVKLVEYIKGVIRAPISSNKGRNNKARFESACMQGCRAAAASRPVLSRKELCNKVGLSSE